MRPTRNQVMDGLVTILETMKTVNTVKRRYQDWMTISQSAEMPYMAVTRPREKFPPRQIKSLPPIRTFIIDLTIYFSAATDQNSIPDEVLCDILDELEATIAPPIGSETQTLGGLVDHCYIDGEIICVPGDIDGQGMIQVPVIIMLP